jgi:GNAT superfamily N-acetyltransferase
MKPFDAARIEEAGLNALQTTRQLFYDGWLVRLSPGKARRARSVNPNFGSSLPLDAKIEYCEALYAQHGLPTLFRMTPFSQPKELDRALEAREYVAAGQTLVQAARLDAPPALPDHARDVALEAIDTADFVEVLGDLRGSTPVQRAAHLERLVHLPLIKRHAAVRVDGRIVCAAQVAIDAGLVGVFDVVTAQDARGNGYATLACADLLHWGWQQGARVAYLQVDAVNAPAIAAYRKFGFETVYTYCYRGRAGLCD